MQKKTKTKKERTAMSVSLYGNLFFVIVEIAMAIYTGSQAVLLDAIYDGIEFVMLLPSIFLIPLLYIPANEDHPYGYMQFETIFLVIKGTTMATVTLGLILNNINFMIHGGRSISFDTVAYFELFACILGIIVTLFLHHKNKTLNSPLIEAEKAGWKIDSIISLGMTIAFFLPRLIKAAWFTPLIPYLDPMITVVLSMVMLPIPVKTVITAFRDLMLLPPEEEMVEEIKMEITPFIEECHPIDSNVDIVRTGRKIWISAYVVLDKEEISLWKLHNIQSRCIERLKQTYSDFFFEIIPEFKEDNVDIIAYNAN